MEPLTIEQLKALEVGDWVWLVKLRNDIKGSTGYYRITEDKYSITMYLYGNTTQAIVYSDYGTNWIAYKNKEQAEGCDEIKRFAEYVGSKIAGHSNYHGDNILSALYCAAEGKDIKDIKSLEENGNDKKVRKEVAKEICSRLGKYNGELYGTCFYDGHYVSDLKDLTNEIANEYGVEVK